MVFDSLRSTRIGLFLRRQKKMASCLSVMELYGSKLLGLPLLPQFQNMFQNSDPNLNWLLQARRAQLLNGMYGNHSASDEERDGDEPDSYPRLGVPLHRSPAVFAALCSLSGRDLGSSEAGPSNSAFTDVTENKREAPQASEKALASSDSDGRGVERDVEPIPFGSYSQHPAPGTHLAFNRGSWRAYPYTKTRPPAPVTTYVQPTEAVKMAPFAPAIPSNLSWSGSWYGTAPMAPAEDSINKSFSAPAELNLTTGARCGRETVQISGDKAQSSAIQTLARRCAVWQKHHPTPSENTFPHIQSERPRSLPSQSEVRAQSNASPTAPPATRSQQRDNFRRLMGGQGGNGPSKLTPRDIALQRHIASSLRTHGVCIIDGLLGDALSTSIKSEVKQLHASERCVKGQLLKGGKDNVSIRGDIITWVEGTEPECKYTGLLCQKLDGIVSSGAGVTPAYKICGGTKVMVARYPGNGARYKKHVDNPAKDGRCLTCIYYINKDWDASTMGGALRLQSQKTGRIADIDPISDRVVIFYSDARNPHEVLPCFNDRYAITLWYFDHDERAKALERIDSMAQTSTSSKSNKK